MIDFHTHTIFSDGSLLPSELLRRAAVIGCRAIAITDHVDRSNIESVLEGIIKFTNSFNEDATTKAIAGVELTHIPPAHIAELATASRRLGAKVVVVHGETTAEPVAEGTNMAAITAGVDILAHPGMITEDECKAAANGGVIIEISGRKGHAFTNGHVARMALKTGAGLILNSDAHDPGDLLSPAEARIFLSGAGLSSIEVDTAIRNSEELYAKITA